MTPGNPSLKLKTARTLKWNLIERVSSQVLYAVTGIVLARVLSQEDFGLVGAVLVFQAFASLFVDSGFSYALLQRKEPTNADYSTVLWFNLGMSVILYIVLFFCAPLIADLFGADERLVPLSRVMFLSFILNGASIVQTNRFMKNMNVRPVAIAGILGLLIGGAVGIILALKGYGAWAIVWQTIVLAFVKGAVLWVCSKWLPALTFSWKRLKSFFSVGGSMMFTSFLNTVFLNIYSFIVGNRVGLIALGYYTQGDKWSKMCVSSMSQILTSTFLPVLSNVQSEKERFLRVTYKMNRMTSYLVFPIFIGLIIEATPLFHALFGTKWDSSIILFQLLLIRGIFSTFTSLYSNCLLAEGHAASIAKLEIWRDVVALAGIVITLPVMGVSTADNPVWGVMVMLWGQVIAGIVAWVLTLLYVKKLCGISLMSLIGQYCPYLFPAVAIGGGMILIGMSVSNPWLAILLETLFGAGCYLLYNAFAGSIIQRDALKYILGKM